MEEFLENSLLWGRGEKSSNPFPGSRLKSRRGKESPVAAIEITPMMGLVE
jgi:hypothetical protein